MWMAIILACALAAFPSQQVAQPANRIALNWVYIRDDLKWKAPPKGTIGGVKYCDNAFLAVLFPSGELVAVFPVLYRDDKTKDISISRGDGMLIRMGHWTKDINGTIRVESSVVYTPLPQVGKTYPYDKREEEWKPSGRAEGRIAARLKTPRATLVPLEHFTDLEFLSNYISAEEATGGTTPTTY